MGDKFNTVNSKLFTNNNPSRLPKWMEDFRDNAEDIINNKKSIGVIAYRFFFYYLSK